MPQGPRASSGTPALAGLVLGSLAGLASAATWGAGDFAGGIAARRTPLFVVVLLSQALGLVLVTVLALVSREALPPMTDVWWAIGAGLSGAVGVTCLYGSLASGRMGIAAPVSGVIAAIIPVSYTWIAIGTPATLGLAGMGVALVGIVLVSAPRAERPPGKVLALALLSGFGFAGFLLLMGLSTGTSFLWTLSAARIGSTLAALAVVLAMRPGLGSPGWAVVVAGLCDTLGNAFFLAATRLARLDVAVVLSSLYPVTTVLLARFVLKEKLSPMQAWGAALMLAAIPLIAWDA